MLDATVIVIAKEPRPGLVKTRLCPPCTPEQAAALARAALADTLAAAARVEVRRRLVVLEGEAGSWLPPDFDVASQEGDDLGERLDHAFGLADRPALLVGMDTPQLGPTLIRLGLAALDADAVDAVLGPAPDGGYWAIGFARPAAGAFDGVPMSSEATFDAQLARLEELGLRTRILPALRDVDTIEDAEAVAAAAPTTRFAGAMRALQCEWNRVAA